MRKALNKVGKMKELLSKIPSINRILLTDKVSEMLKSYPERLVKDVVKTEVDNIKKDILNGNMTRVPEMDEITGIVEKAFEKKNRFSLRRVINATGTILHTNLGRSLLSESVKKNLTDVVFGYSNLEFDIENKRRGSRYVHLNETVRFLTGAEDVLVVNNNAAAVMLALNTLAKDREIVVSRGELVEIGGAFRIPEIIKLSGGTSVEVGTTNKTHLKDYKNAIGENTAVLLKVHTSNYKILGFTEEVSNAKVSNLAKENNLISVSDLGSGQIIDFRKYGLPYEPTVKEVLDSGIDIVTFSGDKLLGGAQAGIIVGKKKYVEAMRRNQLTRALRVDKMTIAALESTFRLYLDENTALQEIPTLQMISVSMEKLWEKAERFAGLVEKMDFEIEISEDKAEVGGGSYPGSYLKSVSVKLTHSEKAATELERRLLLDVEIPVVVRVKDNSIILDMRTLHEKEFEIAACNLGKVTGK